MTNYNERVDEILENIAQKMEKSCEEYFEQTVLDSEYTKSVDKTKDHTKQALTSLTKELVAEAKPTNSVTQRGSVTVYGDLGERELNIINQFEQNLLKALEEV